MPETNERSKLMFGLIPVLKSRATKASYIHMYCDSSTMEVIARENDPSLHPFIRLGLYKSMYLNSKYVLHYVQGLSRD